MIDCEVFFTHQRFMTTCFRIALAWQAIHYFNADWSRTDQAVIVNRCAGKQLVFTIACTGT